MNEKLEQIDEILSSFEDWMHGEDGNKVTAARKLIIELKSQGEEVERLVERLTEMSVFPNCNCVLSSVGVFKREELNKRFLDSIDKTDKLTRK